MLITEKEKNTKGNLYVKNDKVNIFVIGDTHFNHENIIKYCKRPFNNMQQMNETIINNWNKTVRPYDIVYHLGDFGFGNQIELKTIFDKLNGKKYLIMGNHDKRVGQKYYEEIGFTKVYKQELRLGNLILSHNPIEIKDREYINIHAHIHNTEPNEKFKDNRHICVSVEMIDYLPANVMHLVGGDISGKSLYQDIEEQNQM